MEDIPDDDDLIMLAEAEHEMNVKNRRQNQKCPT